MNNPCKLGFLFALLTCTAYPSWSGVDTSTTWLTPVSAQIFNQSGAQGVFITATGGSFVNPAACAATDGYVTADPVISNGTLAMALTAITAGRQIQLYVSGTACANSRPMILDIMVQ